MEYIDNIKEIKFLKICVWNVNLWYNIVEVITMIQSKLTQIFENNNSVLTTKMENEYRTNYTFVYHVSFPRGYHLFNAKEQNIKPYYVEKSELEDEYIETIDSWDSNPLRVTNIEKTIIDILRLKNPTPGLVDEMLGDYLNRENKNIKRLMEYGKKFNVEKILDERILTIAK